MRKIIFNTQNQAAGRNSVSPYIKPGCFIIFFLFPISLTALASDPISQIYKTGTTFQLTASRLGLSAEGIMEVLENTKFRDEDVILVRSRVTKMGGLMGFLVKFLRIYKGSNTFDSYLDSNTFMTARYEVYRLNDDGTKKLTEHVYFDREGKKAISLQDNEVIASNIPSDTQDTFSIFLGLLRKINTEELFVGKTFETNLYAHKEIHKFNIEVTDLMIIDRTKIYTLMIEDLPGIFKYPTSIEIKVTNVDEGFLFPVYGKCVIHIPIFPDVSVEGRLGRITDH